MVEMKLMDTWGWKQGYTNENSWETIPLATYLPIVGF
jgi:hypothetical protein